MLPVGVATIVAQAVSVDVGAGPNHRGVGILSHGYFVESVFAEWQLRLNHLQQAALLGYESAGAVFVEQLRQFVDAYGGEEAQVTCVHAQYRQRTAVGPLHGAQEGSVAAYAQYQVDIAVELLHYAPDRRHSSRYAADKVIIQLRVHHYLCVFACELEQKVPEYVQIGILMPASVYGYFHLNQILR